MADPDVFMRDFNRYTGDGLPNEPVGAPLPIGDSESGAFVPTKKDLRDWVSAIAINVADESSVLTKAGNFAGLTNVEQARTTLGVFSKAETAEFTGQKTITNAKLVDMPASTIKGRFGTDGTPQDLSPSDVKSLLAYTTDDLAETPTRKFVRAGSVGDGDLADGAVVTAKLADKSATNAKLADMVAGRIKGRFGTDGTPQDLSGADAKSILAINGGDVADTASRAMVHPRDIPVSHGAPLVGDLVKRANGDYIFSPQTQAIGQPDGFGSIFSRVPYRHGAPTTRTLIRRGSGDYVLEPVQAVFALAGVNAGEAVVGTSGASWRATDGANNGGPIVLAANADGGLNLLRKVPYPLYPTGPRKVSFPSDVNWSFSPSVRTVIPVVYLTQSQGAGANFRLINSVCPVPGRLGMFAGGARPGVQSPLDLEHGHDYLFTPSDLGGIVDLRETYDRLNAKYAESPMTALCASVLTQHDATTGVMGVNASVSGTAIEDLGLGAAPWHNVSIALGYFRLLCEIRGVNMGQPVLFTTGNGSNRNDTPEQYAAKMTSLYYDPWQALMVEHGFVAHAAPMFVGGSVHNTANETMGVTRAALVMADDPARNIVAVGPEYLFTSVNDEKVNANETDTTHISSEGIVHRAYFEGEAYARWRAGGKWEPLRILSAVRSGVTVTLTLNTAAANLTMPVALNSPAITDVPNEGFSWRDAGDGNAVAITAVAVNGSDQIVVTLSDVPTGTGQEIGYALADTATNESEQGPVVGARGEVSDSTPGTLTINGKSYSPRRHLHTDLVNVTV
jgi:hypothetical protein